MFKYDKLKNLNSEDNTFEFKCPHCGCDGFKKDNFELKPVGVSWRPDILPDDIQNEVIKKGIAKLPDLRNALVLAARGLTNYIPEQEDPNEQEKDKNKPLEKTNNGVRVTIRCKKCDKHLTQTKRLCSTDVKKWCNINLEYYMDLRPRSK